jgi:hypothetical protein
LSAGTHTLEVWVTDANDEVIKDSITVTRVNQVPVPVIHPPTSPYIENVPFLVAGTASDADLLTSIPCDDMTWTLFDQGVSQPISLGSGCTVEVPALDEGSWELQLCATDGYDTACVSEDLEIQAFPDTGPPVVSVISPVDWESVDEWESLQLFAAASDPDDQQGRYPLSYTWTWQWGSRGSGTICTGNNCTWSPHDVVWGNCSSEYVTVTLTVTDTSGESTVEQRTVAAFFPPC